MAELIALITLVGLLFGVALFFIYYPIGIKIKRCRINSRKIKPEE